jgi:cytochrome b561
MLLIRDTRTRFGLISVLLHWYTAIVVLFILLPTGLLIYYIGPHGALRPLRADLTFFHQSVALTSIPFFLARIFWRFGNGKPKTYRQHWIFSFSAEVVWRLLLLLIVVQMLTGPFFEDLQWFGVELFRLNWPESLAAYEDYLPVVHLWAAYTIAGILVFHIGGALRHHFILKDGVLKGMLWPVVPDAPATQPQAIPASSPTPESASRP